MLYKDYGKTGDKVSVIGFGGMRFKDQKDIDTCAALVNSAYEKGINYFDTAPGYGDSEKLFGVALQEMKKQRNDKPFYISTKTSQSNPADIRRELETSLTHMGLDTIDFYHVWCLLNWEMYDKRKQKGALKEFEKLKEEGLIKHITVSSHMAGNDIERLLNDYPFEGILLGYSAMNFSYREQGLIAAEKLNRGVVVMNPLGGGIIPQHPDRFAFVKSRADESVVDGALRFLIDDSRISVVLVGIGEEKELADAIKAVDGYEALSKSHIQFMRENISIAFDQLCTGCQYCDHCPENIPVPKMMDAYNQYMFSGEPASITNRLKWHWGIEPANPFISDQCSQCKHCEELCTQSLPIIERLQLISSIIKRTVQGNS